MTIEWLRTERSFNDATIRRFRLGLIPRDYWIARQAWGLPEQVNENGKPKKLWVPAGIVIPLIGHGKVQRIRIRRWEGEPRYYVLPGGDTTPLLIGKDKEVFVIVESELDAMLIHQEAGDAVGVVALGSSSTKPDQEAAEVLERARTILVALDADAAGYKAAAQWWLANFTQAERWPPVGGKDPGDMAFHGEDIRTWIMAGLPAEEHL